MQTIRSWWPWKKEAPPLHDAEEKEADLDHRRRLSLDRTYETAQEQEQDLREAADRIQAELDVLRREH